jgi:mono/diheme cytochrome c family protein
MPPCSVLAFATSKKISLAKCEVLSCLKAMLLSLVGTLVSHPGMVFAQEFDEETVPGLLTTLSDGVHSVQRRDRTISFDWTGTPADSRLNNVTTAEWSGRILVRQQGAHRFHASLGGRVTIEIDGKPVLAADGDGIFASGELIELTSGDHDVAVKFTSLPKVDPKLHLFWSSPMFTLEPLPADGFSNSILPEESPHAAAVLNAVKTEHGRLLADSLRCSACHAGLDEMPTVKAPSLAKVTPDSERGIVDRLLNPTTVNAHSAMPSFGFSEQDVADIAAFLLQNADAPKLDKVPKPKDGDTDAGGKLLLTTGCVTCHVIPSAPDVRPSSTYHGPDLTAVSQRRSGEWLITWLRDPEKLNPHHRMPVFDLSDDERRQIVSALVASSVATDSNKDQQSPKGNAESGRKLVLEANCRSCHDIPNIEPSARLARPEWKPSGDAARSCVVTERHEESSDQPSEKRRQPKFVRSTEDHDAMALWIQSIAQPLRPIDHFAKGELLLHRHGCIACHDRDQHRGISAVAASIESLRDDLRGQSQALIPPALTAVGDRLRDDALTDIIAGKQTTRRLPWLSVRMPRFPMSKGDQDAIARYLIASDRIPDAADDARKELFEHYNPHHPVLATTDELLTGNQLVGAAGFNCIACHKAGPYEPRNVALGTRGSDIMTMGQRVRSRYFLRWMQNPIRVVPGIEMPAIRKAVPGVLHDSMPEQFAVMWKALSDARFSPPTVVSRYEQIVNIAPGQRPRVIRDVFTLPGSNPSDPKARNSVARAFAVGFENGHNVLLDLDTMQLRQWTIGEFARQRTEGKSWFWDLAGVTITDQATDHFAVQLKLAEHDQPLAPDIDEQRMAELLSWKINADSVSLRLRYRFEPTSQPQATPQEPTKPSGAERSRHTALTAWNDPARPMVSATMTFTLQSIGRRNVSSANADSTARTTGIQITATVDDAPPNASVLLPSWLNLSPTAEIPWRAVVGSADAGSANSSNGVALQSGQSEALSLLTDIVPPAIQLPPLPSSLSIADELTSVPGFEGTRLPISTNIMPTNMAILEDGRLAFTSLRGQIWIASDTNGDGLHDSLHLFAEGFASPYGIHADGLSLLVSHKPEVVRMRDSDGDNRADEFDVYASGWGFSDDYHDWTTALVRDRSGNYFVGLGSDYGTQARTRQNDRWRGTILRIDSNGVPSPIAYSFRFPMGLAISHQGHLFATDNQGVQNTFNEINHIIEGKHYGVPSRFETVKDAAPEIPGLMVPHPWTRSVNAIAFFPQDYPVVDLAGHGIGCEYDTRCLIRFTVQDVDGTLQGASYRFSLPDQPGGGANFVGPIATTFGSDGSLYIGSIWDSGWQGGTNTGSIERLRPSTARSLPNGIREIKAMPTGFEVSFFHPVDAQKAVDPSHWSLQAYTRAWGGSYATPDSDRHSVTPTDIKLSEGRKTVTLKAGPFKAGYVYEIAVKSPLDDSKPGTFWPSEGHYSMKVVPKH